MRETDPDIKRAELIGKILTRIIKLSTDKSRGAPEIRERMDRFYFPSVAAPNRHLTGTLKVGNFEDGGLWVRATSINASHLTERLHNLFLYSGDQIDDPIELERRQPRYHVAELGKDGGALRPPMEFVGIEAMAAAPYDISTDLTKIETVVEYEYAARWKNHKVVTPNDVVFSRKARNHQ